MAAPSSPQQPLALDRLLPAGPSATAQEIVEDLDLHLASAAPTPGALVRPRVLLNMVSTIDGRATIGGHSGPIGGRADRELFHALRTAVDAVMVGAGTARAERYRTLVREESARALRRQRGLREQPLACIVSGRLELGNEIPLLADPQAQVAILTSSQASLPDAGAQIEYIRAAEKGRLDLPAALAELHERLAVGTVLCEGGPHLNAQLLAAGLVDELFLSLGPVLAGGGSATGEALRILAGADLDPPVELALLGVLEHESHLFLRYRVSPPAPAGGSPPAPARGSPSAPA